MLTALPYSEPGAPVKEPDPLDRGFFFYDEGALPNVAIVSTFVWDKLPINSGLPVLQPSGRRALGPYLCNSLAIIALNRLFDVPFHPDTRSCPLDYCHHVGDIDASFKGTGFCRQDRQLLDQMIRDPDSPSIARRQVEAVEALLRLSRGIGPGERYRSCFISYGAPDKAFAVRLHRDLTRKGVTAWLYELHSTVGAYSWREINLKLSEADRVLVLCSALSLRRDGVLKEIELQVDQAPDKIVPISLDRDWRNRRFRVMRGPRDLKPYLIDKTYADFEDSYPQALNRLLEALRIK